MEYTKFFYNSSYDVATACCGCPAGKGLTASCRHIGTLCYALVSFCRLKILPDFVTPIERLQEWNRLRPCKAERLQEWNCPRPCKAEAIPVIELSTQTNEIKKKLVSFSFKDYNPQSPSLKIRRSTTVSRKYAYCSNALLEKKIT